MVIKVIKVNLIQKKLLNHLKNYVINLLILTNLMNSMINLRIMLQNLKIINPKLKVDFLKTKKKKKNMERYDRDLKILLIFIIFIILNRVVIQVKKVKE